MRERQSVLHIAWRGLGRSSEGEILRQQRRGHQSKLCYAQIGGLAVATVIILTLVPVTGSSPSAILKLEPPSHRRDRTPSRIAPMQRSIVPVILAGLGLAGPLLPQAPASTLKQQVFAAESSFAASMAERNFEAFGSHVSPEAIFFGDTTVMRGKTAGAPELATLLREARPALLLEAGCDRGAAFGQARPEQRPGIRSQRSTGGNLQLDLAAGAGWPVVNHLR